MSQRTTDYIRPVSLTVKSLGTYQNQSEILNISALDRTSFPPFLYTAGSELNPEKESDLSRIIL